MWCENSIGNSQKLLKLAFKQPLKSDLDECAQPFRDTIALEMLKQVYGLTVHIHDWPISTEPGKWMAEIPELPGCRAWGDTPEEANEIISDLAVHFMEDEVTERAPTTDVPTG